jgi:hypothetical protein
MKRVFLVVTLVAGAVAPAAAQWAGMPVWNSPSGGTGITISGDYGKPSADAYGKGSAFGARGTVGLGSLSLTAGLASFKASGATNSQLSYGATAAFRVIGGSLLPVNLNLLVGGTGASKSGPLSSFTTIIAGGGASVSVPTPGLSIEPYLSVTNRWHKVSGSPTNSNIGWTIGANLGLGMLGAHIAYDSENFGGGVTGSVIGLGVHVSLHAPGL